MRKSIKSKLIAVVLTIMSIVTFGFGGCTGTKGEPGVLRIRYFVGGYGNAWLINATNKYKAQHPDVQFDLVRDQSINDMASIYLSQRNANADLYMANDFVWQESAISGQIAEIDDVYQRKVVLGGQEMTIYDALIDNYKFYPYIEKVPGNSATKHAYAMPWAANNVSIIYNEDLMKKTPKTGGGNWTAFPETETEYKQFLADINSASGTSAYGNKTVYPFVFAGASENVLTWIHTTWWAQYQGINGKSIEGEGSYEDFWQFASPEVYKQSGLVEAYRLLQDTMINMSTGTWKNAPDDVGALGAQDAELEFIKGKAVMTVNGSWLENEVIDLLEDAETYPNLKDSLRMAMLPAINGAQVTDVNNVYARSLMAIHKNSVNVELAKDFMAFLCTEQQLADFTKYTGTMRPFKYNPMETLPDYEWSPFRQDIINMFFSGNNIFEGSGHPLYVNINLTPYRPTNSTVLGYLRQKTPQSTVDSIFTYIDDNWNTWKTQAGIL